jgi:hypothetical protein
MSLLKEKLSDRPKPSDPHIQADYIELLCLTTLDKAISKADILGDYKTEVDLDVNLTVEGEVSEDDPIASIDDKNTQKVNEYFEHFAYRISAFGEHYPFEIAGSGSILKLKNTVNDVSLKQKLYIFLLLASLLKYLHSSVRNNMTSAFESVSSKALEAYLPSHAKVQIFGKNTLGEREAETHKLIEKIKLLAMDIRESVSIDLEREFRGNNTGDRGLDIVAWIPIDDNSPGLILAFGQCACSLEEWVSKQHSSSFDSWRRIINFTVPPHNMAFIPFCFRDAGGIWWKESDIHSSILFDRLRIIRLLKLQVGKLEHLPYEIIEEILSYNEPLPELY